MSQENVEVVKRHYEAVNRGDIAALLGAVDPDCVWWDRDDDPDAAVHRGVAAMQARLSEIDAVWVELRLKPEEFIDTGDFVVVPIRAFGRGRTSEMGARIR